MNRLNLFFHPLPWGRKDPDSLLHRNCSLFSGIDDYEYEDNHNNKEAQSYTKGGFEF